MLIYAFPANRQGLAFEVVLDTSCLHVSVLQSETLCLIDLLDVGAVDCYELAVGLWLELELAAEPVLELEPVLVSEHLLEPSAGGSCSATH